VLTGEIEVTAGQDVTAAAQASVNPVPQPETNSFWTAVFNWFNGIYDSLQVGRV
jgi:hypothetical protein